jgi:hypothetical protein
MPALVEREQVERPEPLDRPFTAIAFSPISWNGSPKASKTTSAPLPPVNARVRSAVPAPSTTTTSTGPLAWPAAPPR